METLYCPGCNETFEADSGTGNFWDFVGEIVSCPKCGKRWYVSVEGDTDSGFYYLLVDEAKD